MKLYHEVAVVKDGNKRVGWLLKEGPVQAQPADLVFVTEEEFKSLVKNDKVQCFVVENNQLKIKYSDEELAMFKKLKIKDSCYSNLKDYLSHDMTLQYAYLSKAFTGLTPYVYVLNSAVQSNMTLLQGYIFTSQVQMAYTEMMMWLNNSNMLDIIKGVISRNIRCYNNYMMFIVPIELLEILGKDANWNISCKGLKIAEEIMLKSKSRKSAVAYYRAAHGTEIENIIKRVETV